MFPNPGGTGGTAFAPGGGKFRFVLSSLLLLKKNVAVHNDLTDLEFHLNPVDDSTANWNVQWYINNTISLVIVQHVIHPIQICSMCQK